MKEIEVLLLSPRGFCAGVERAINIVELALEKYGPPIYVRHEIVHNKHVVKSLGAKGAIFIDRIDNLNEGDVVIFSAHGVSERVERQAHERNLHIIDASCPLVKKVHIEAQRREREGDQIILIGHKDHPEVEGTSGRVKQEVLLVQTIADIEALEVRDMNRLAYITQTTLSTDDTKLIVEKLRERFPNIKGQGISDICYATQNRQDAIKTVLNKINALLVIGSQNSSNSNRLRDIGLERNIPSYLIDHPDEVNGKMLDNINRIAVTAGASAPEVLVKMILDRLSDFGNINIINIATKKEDVHFRLPKELIEGMKNEYDS